MKHQLRGLERLLKRTTDETHVKQLQEQIQSLKAEMDTKQVVDKQRDHAKQSHGTRFLERQKLVRMERNIRSNPNMHDKEQELLKIALDQIYVAHFPMDFKYLPLFRQGSRRVDIRKILIKRAKLRNQILQNFFQNEDSANSAKSWIVSEQYDRVKTVLTRKGSKQALWTLEQEQSMFGEASIENGHAARDDPRFQQSATDAQNVLLAAVEQAEAAAEAFIEVDAPRKASNEEVDSDIEDDADPLKDAIAKRAPSVASKEPSSPQQERQRGEAEKEDDAIGESSSSDDSSDDDSSSDDTISNEDDDKHESIARIPITKNNDEDDDFFMAYSETNDDKDAFNKPKERMVPVGRVKGDKSQGWATQNRKIPYNRDNSRRNYSTVGRNKRRRR